MQHANGLPRNAAPSGGSRLAKLILGSAQGKFNHERWKYGAFRPTSASLSIWAVSTLSVLAETPGMTAPMQANSLPPTFQASWPPPPIRHLESVLTLSHCLLCCCGGTED
jgi:hypothetical protein